MKYFFSFLFLTLVLIFFSGVESARAQSLVGVYNDWAAYTLTEQNTKTCYVRSKPTRTEPRNLNHGEVHFFVSYIPSQGIQGQPYFMVGYSFQSNSSVGINIGGKTFTMFTEDGGAWIEDDNVEPALIQSMIDGNTMTVSGVSGRGNKTSYRFSLRGVTKALEEARKACS